MIWFGYAIVDRDNKPYTIERSYEFLKSTREIVMREPVTSLQHAELESEVDVLNRNETDERRPYRIAQLMFSEYS